MSNTVQKEKASISNSVYGYYYRSAIGADFNVFYPIR